MIWPNDGKNKKNSLSGHETPPSEKYKEVPVFSTAQPCHLADKRHISNFFRSVRRLAAPFVKITFRFPLYQFSDFLPLPAHTSLIETHNLTSTHLKITTYSFSFIWKSCDFHMGKKLVKALQIFYVTFTRGISSSVTHTLPLKPNSRNTARSLHNCGTLTHIFYQNVLHITVKLGS